MDGKRVDFAIDRIAAGVKQTEPGISERTFCGRRRRHALLQNGQLKELKQLQNENTRLKKLVTQLKLDKSILQNFARLCSASKPSS